MTYTQSLNDIKTGTMRYQGISKVFFSSFLNVKNVTPKEIPDKEKEIRMLYSLLNTRLYLKGITKAEKIEFIDYIEKLQLALEVLAINKGTKDIPSLKKAAAHMAKKMQSSVPGKVTKKRNK